MADFSGQTVLITGGTAGIGLASARRFAAAGAEVLVAARDAERGASAVSDITSAGGRARFITADLSAAAGSRALAEEAGAVDVLVNNVGIFPTGPTHEMGDDVVAGVFATNVLGPFALTAAVLPGMLQRGRGAIVNVSTMVASFGMPGMSAYGASKAAIESLTQAWAAEYSGSGIRINAVAPGPTLTPAVAAFPEEALAGLTNSLPMKRAASPEEIAAAIVFLASEDASFITGTTLAVDGGRTAV